MDFEEARELVRAQTERPHDSLYERFASSSLVAFFNRHVPENLRLPDAAQVIMEVSTISGDRFSAHDLSRLTNHMSKAVAFMSRDIAHKAPGARLSSADFDRAELVVRAMPTGPVVFTAPRTIEIMDGLSSESSPGRAMTRLANLLPAEEGVPSSESLLALRPLELRAVHEVVRAARPVRGIRVSVAGPEEQVNSRVTGDQAKDLDKFLSDLTERVTVLEPVLGTLDGMRFSRRSFALQVEGSADYEGVIDEGLLAKAKLLLGQPVWARLEQVEKIRGDGRVLAPTYRLIEIGEP